MIRGLNDAGGGGGNNGGGGGGQPDCVQMLKDWWANCPVFTKGLFTTCWIVYALSFFLPVAAFLALTVASVTHYFFVWTILTSPLYNGNLIMLLFGLLSYIPRATQ